MLFNCCVYEAVPTAGKAGRAAGL